MQRNNRMTVTIERKNEKERARFSRKFLPQRALSQVKTKQNRMQLYNKQTFICQHMRLQCICFSLIFQPIFFQPVGLFSLCSDKLISNKIHKKKPFEYGLFVLAILLNIRMLCSFFLPSRSRSLSLAIFEFFANNKWRFIQICCCWSHCRAYVSRWTELR